MRSHRLRVRHRIPAILRAVDIVTGEIQEARIGDVVAHRQGGSHMRDHAVQLVNVQLVALAQLTAGGAETGQSEGGRHVRTHLLHAAREAIQLNDQ